MPNFINGQGEDDVYDKLVGPHSEALKKSQQWVGQPQKAFVRRSARRVSRYRTLILTKARLDFDGSGNRMARALLRILVAA